MSQRQQQAYFTLESPAIMAGAIKEWTQGYPQISIQDLSFIAQNAMSTAKGYARVKTGYMRDHISMRVVSDYEVIVYAEAIYSKYQEFGTSRISPNAFFQRTFDESVNRLQALHTRSVQSYLQSIARKSSSS